MTSRERVEIALNHKEPDRLPIDLGGLRATGIMVSAYDRLKKHLGIDTGVNYVYDMKQMLAIVEEPVLERLGVDVVPLFRKRYFPYPINAYPDRWKQWRLFDGTEVDIPADYTPEENEKGDLILSDEKGDVVGHMPEGGYYFDYPRAAADLVKKGGNGIVSVEEYKPSRGFPEEELRCLQNKVDYLFDHTDFAILADGGFLGLGNGSFRASSNLESVEYTDWIMLLTEQEYVREILEKTTDFWIENLKSYHQAVGDKICAIVFSDDLGTQNAELMNPELFKELIAPYYKKVWDWVHKNTEWKVFLHSCGSIYHTIPTLIDCGLDILNPVQCSAENMDPERLKREFGDKLVFWGGGCDTQQTLPFGKPEEIREEVRERIETFAPGGGFIFNQVHNIQHGTLPENVMAMFDVVSEFGKYPIGAINNTV